MHLIVQVKSIYNFECFLLKLKIEINFSLKQPTTLYSVYKPVQHKHATEEHNINVYFGIFKW